MAFVSMGMAEEPQIKGYASRLPPPGYNLGTPKSMEDVRILGSQRKLKGLAISQSEPNGNFLELEEEIPEESETESEKIHDGEDYVEDEQFRNEPDQGKKKRRRVDKRSKVPVHMRTS